jgi:dolichol kinase
MFKIFIALFPVALILIASEMLWRKHIAKGERARKFIHILAGAWMAFWPHYLPFDGIFILGCVALVLLVYSRFSHLFSAIYDVDRKTYGEITYALAIIVCSYLGLTPWVFTVSILILALADGGAAVVGRFWGLSNQYFVMGIKNLRKSISGTIAFFLLTYVALLIGWFIGGEDVIRDNFVVVLLVLPLSATLLENIAPYGLDNLFTPLFVTLLLNSLV